MALRVAGRLSSVCGALGTKSTEARLLSLSAAPQWPWASGLLNQALDLEKNGSDALITLRTGLPGSKLLRGSMTK